MTEAAEAAAASGTRYPILQAGTSRQRAESRTGSEHRFCCWVWEWNLETRTGWMAVKSRYGCRLPFQDRAHPEQRANHAARQRLKIC